MTTVLTLAILQFCGVCVLSKALSINFIIALLVGLLYITPCVLTLNLLYARTLKNVYRIIKLIKMALQTPQTPHFGVSHA